MTEGRRMSLDMHSLILPVLQNMGIGTWLGGLTMQSWPSKCKASFQCNDIMAKNTNQKDDAFSKQVKRLHELHGCWKTKQEIRKWGIE